MAEERIIDDDIDKNKKYRIVKGEDGEDELIIDEVEEEEDLTFLSPEELIDDGEAGVLTAEQYEAAKILQEEEERRLKEELEELKTKTVDCLAQDKYSDALDCIAAAEELAPENGEIKCARLEAITRKFTDFAATDEIIEACKQVEEHGGDERKNLFEKYGERLASLKAENTAKLEKMDGQYKAEQQARREILAPRKSRALKIFAVTLAIFAIFLIAAIACSTVMFSMQNGVMLAVTIVLAALAFVAFVALIFTARNFSQAARMSSANEKDFSTKLGRERAALAEFCAALDAAYSAVNVNTDDIS